ncbi:ADP-ribosylglycohydrolase family protein [Cryobacterium suzukii]|uniref:ADP-ribosylglycohydrolase family protein n=1 Tax=Cryobacterium suzukii TaxID=1259198 RepID=A0A4R9AIA4_9MICO|nr:ADP-ribosylglycohydrolase family protein [Cryobacterium suzukii]TFD61607.1 ADP-ribosylglycohydrolase family protein [Cryobacterium suzukii]
MSAEDAMMERTARLFDGICAVTEENRGYAVNVDKWLDPVIGRVSGRDRVKNNLAVFLAGVDAMVAILPEARVSAHRNEVSVVCGKSSVVASFSFYRLNLSQRSDGRLVALGGFSPRMAVRSVLWLLAVSEWGDEFERKFERHSALPVVRSARNLGFHVRSTDEMGGTPGEVWTAEDAVFFAQGCAVDVDELLAAAREFAGRSVVVPRGLSREDRIQGCLLGGAVGDALGYPVEFWSLAAIVSDVGAAGVREFLAVPHAPVGAISDDTQMTLFTADALARADGTVPVRALMVQAYRDWYLTQTTLAASGVDVSGPGTSLLGQSWLFAQRAPGLTVMAALKAIPAGVAAERVSTAENQSKGCGTVMRSAPFGLVASWTAEESYTHAAQAASITHGHPAAQVAAGALAMLVHRLVGGESLTHAATGTLNYVVRTEPDGFTETSSALRKASSRIGRSVPVPKVTELLGAGWVAEEALAIAVYCALTFPDRDQVEEALSLAVTHSGDSDSTGAICGNILGALHGLDAIPARWRQGVEGRDSLLAVGAQLAMITVGP